MPEITLTLSSHVALNDLALDGGAETAVSCDLPRLTSHLP